MSTKRILIFSLAYHPVVGGAEIAVKEITDRIPDLEFDLVTLRFSKKHSAEEKVGNVNVYRIGGGFGYFSKIFFVPQAALWALKMTKVRPYDALWSIMTYMLFPIVWMRMFGDRTPYALTLQDGDPHEHVFGRIRILPFLPMLLYGFRHATKVQAISNFLAKWARGMGYKGPLEVIPNGVDVEKFVKSESRIINKESVTLITTSRLVEKNGIGDIIKSLKFLPEFVNLKILGTGPLELELKSLVKEKGVNSRVVFLSHIFQGDIPTYLNGSDIFVRPSLSEGMGNSFIEAMAAGIPVVATSVGGIPDFLKDRETGLFCEVNNPKSVADKVMEYVNNPELTSKIVENARKMVVEKYDWNLIAKEMKTEVFDKV